MAGGDAPSAADAPLGLSARRSTLQGDNDVSGEGPDDVHGDVADPGDSALGDRTLGRLEEMTAHRHPRAE